MSLKCMWRLSSIVQGIYGGDLHPAEWQLGARWAACCKECAVMVDTCIKARESIPRGLG